MNAKKSLAGCFLLWLGLAARGQAQTFTLQTVADTFLREGGANQTGGGDAVLQLSGNQRVLLRVDQAAVASAVGSGRLVSATLELWVRSASGWGNDGRSVEAHRLTADWTEAGATWSCAIDTQPANGRPDCATRWNGGTFEEDSSDTILQTNDGRGRVQLDVTADVAAFLAGTPNRGWLLKREDDASGGRADYTSREGAAAERPRLVLLVETAANDQVPPSLAITSPVRSILVNEPTPTVTLEYADGGSGVDTATLQLLVDGQDATARCTAGALSASCPLSALAAGNHTLQARLRDRAGNTAQAGFSFQLLLGSGPHLVTFQSIGDTYLRKGGANQNQGAEPVLRLREGGQNRSLVQFDAQNLATTLAGATLVSAALELHVEKNGRNWGKQGRAVDVHRVTAAWTELGATWNCPVDSNPTNGQADCAAQWNGGSFAPAPTASVLHTRDLTGWVSFNVTADVAAFTSGTPNRGWLIKKTDEKKSGRVDYDSRQGTAGEGPRLVVVFTTQGGGGDTTPPTVAITAPAAGSLVNTGSVTVSGTVADLGGVAGVRVNNVDATISGGQFQAVLFLNEGTNQVLVDATDAAGNHGTASSTVRLDTRLPDLSLEAPVPGQLVNSGSVRVAGRATDANGITAVTVNGAPVSLDPAGAFATQVPVGEGPATVAAHAFDGAGNAASLSVQVIGFTLPSVAIDSPADLSFLAATTVDVTGTVSDPSAVVTVNGVPAVVAGNRFTAPGVPLIEGGNVLTAAAILPNGHASTASIDVVRDLTPPHLTVDAPHPGSVVFAPNVTVSGLVNDIVAGTVNATEATVTVNGRPAAVANRSYVATGVPLSAGDNTLTVIATDRSGNVAQATATVRLAAPTVPHLSIVSGDRQQAVVGDTLAQPLVVALVDGAGAPLAGRPVVWSVRGGDGTLDGGRRQLVATTDASGRASAHFTLGRRAGAATQTVEVSTPGLAATVLFTFSALPGPASLIVVDSGNQQVGIAGQAVPRPLVAAVTDAGFNRRQGVAVEFKVVAGAGRFANGLPEVTVTTDSDGRAIVPFVLDPVEGVASNTVVATVAGLEDGPLATFIATGLAAGDPAATSISGVVLDNSNLPIEGVTLRIFHSTLTAQTDARGQFRIAGAPVGSVTLIVDGSTANRPGAWPDLEFVLTTVPGRDNTVNMPIYLLPIDVAHGVPVDETRGGTLTLAELPGFSLEIAPGSVTFPGGSRSGVVSVTAVHSDKVPMVPNFGQQPRFIVTIQPPGARFDPPARMTMPNVDGLPPGAVTEFYSFDHDLGHFVSIGPATVSGDGTVITSNPGVGIVKGGWHCGGDPATSGTAHACTDCQKCVDDNCVTDPAKEGRSCDDREECTGDDKCTGGTCRGTRIRVTITRAPTVVCVNLDKPAAATIEPNTRPIFWRALNPNIFTVAGNDSTATVRGVARGTGTLVAQDAQTDCSKDQRSIQVITKEQDFNGFGEKTMCALGSLGGEEISARIAAACSRGYRLARTVQAWEDTFNPQCRGEGSWADAARHARWSCELYRDPLTRDFADEILRRHENRPDDPCISHEQDLNNNEVGRANATAGRDCTAAALQDLAAGNRLQINNPPAPGVRCP